MVSLLASTETVPLVVLVVRPVRIEETRSSLATEVASVEPSNRLLGAADSVTLRRNFFPNYMVTWEVGVSRTRKLGSLQCKAEEHKPWRQLGSNNLIHWYGSASSDQVANTPASICKTSTRERRVKHRGGDRPGIRAMHLVNW